MSSEYEKLEIKQLRTWLWVIVIVAIILLGVVFQSKASLKNLSFVINLVMFGIVIYFLFREKSEDSVELMVDIQDVYRKVTGKYIDMQGSTHASIGDKLYYYFPKEYFGLEYDWKKRKITAQLMMSVPRWIKHRTNIDILGKLTEKEVIEEKERRAKEDAGYIPKE